MNRSNKIFKKFDMEFADIESEIHKELLTAMKKHRQEKKRQNEKREKTVTKQIESLEKKREKLLQQLIEIDNTVYSLQLSLIHSS